MEELFRSQMDSYKMEPSPGLWQKVHAKIFWKQFLGFSVQSFNVYYLAAAISLAGVGAYTLFSGDQAKPVDEIIQNETVTAVQVGPQEQTVPETGTEKIENGRDAGQGEIPASKPAITKLTEKEKPEEPAGTEPAKVKEAEIKENKEVSGEEVSISAKKKSESIRVSVDFESSMTAGCAPLKVDFTNQSVNADQYTWMFGDGGSSSEKDPSYLFDEPGEYNVTLRVRGQDGANYQVQKTIHVFESPKALFEMDRNVGLSDNQPVYFYNYSKGADYYSWDFGDRQGSELVEPIHYYEKAGSYNVKLVVWTQNQCYDSLIIMNAFKSQENEIKFPNAFTPNMTGPTGGYYEHNDPYNTIFHPVVSGDLEEYQLKIYNRVGLLVFESNDISFGWDGYYQEKLASQGVYIWKARGKFSNGQTFVKSGDLTLIRQY